MFGISGTELGIVLVFALIIFGPDKLPQLGRTVGRFMSEFKRAQEMMETSIKAEMYEESAKPVVQAPVTAQSWTASDDEDEEDEE